MFRTRQSASQVTEDLQRFVSDLGDTLRQAQVDLRDKLENQQMRIRDIRQKNNAQRKLRNAFDNVRSGSYRAVESTREQTARRPLTVMFGALLAGIVVGRFFFNR